jgi:hypothetical protein
MTDKLARFAFYCLILVAPVFGSGGGDAAPTPAPTPVPQPTGFEYRVPADRRDGWSVAPATEQGVDERALETMMDAMLEGEFDVIDSIAISSSR